MQVQGALGAVVLTAAGIGTPKSLSNLVCTPPHVLLPAAYVAMVVITRSATALRLALIPGVSSVEGLCLFL